MVRKRLALATVALLLAVLVIAVVGGRMVDKCRPEYTLITPDGMVFNLQGPGRMPGSGASLVALEGGGLPPVQHVSQLIYDQPGSLLLDVQVQDRVITITESVYATDATRYGLHRALAAIWDAVRWDRGPSRNSPTILRYTIDGTSRDLYIHYSGAVESQQGRYGRNELVGLRFEAHDPMWYDDEGSSMVLDWSDALTVRYFLERVDGVWGQAITQPAVVGGGAPAPYAIAIHPATGDIYIGGDFTGWGAFGNDADYLVRWRAATDTWGPVGDDGAGGPALNSVVFDLLFGPDGHTLYVCGAFTNAGGVATADYLAQVDVQTDTWDDVGGGPGGGAVVTYVHGCTIGHDGTLYITGDFTNWQGDAHISSWDGAGWPSLGNLNASGYDVAILPDGDLIAVGNATTWGGVAANRVARWDGLAWSALGAGTNGTAETVVVAADGTVYIGGVFTTAGGETVNRIARWNGSAWSGLGVGMNNTVYKLALAGNGDLYATGDFTEAGGLVLTDRVARWNGFSWTHLDVDLPGAGSILALLVDGSDVYLGGRFNGTAYVAGDNSVVNVGSAFALPIIEVKNQGLLQSIRNETLGLDIPCDMQILDGEIVTIDLSTGRKTVDSTWRPLGRLSDILPNSDLGSFKLESHPRADYGGAAGANLITVFITGADPRESGDTFNQFSNWGNITGISQDNTDLGKLRVKITYMGDPYLVDLYDDAATAHLVGMGIGSLAAGPVNLPIAEQNDSGLGGTVTVNPSGDEDYDIVVWYTIVTMTWTPRWWSLDEAVLSATP